MKILKNLSVPQIIDAIKFPWGQIKNETETEAGTPVVKDIYGDILVNHYKLLQYSGIEANGLEDNEQNGYQILEALKNFVNVLNDVEKVVSLTGTEWTVNLDFSKLPDKYVFFARMSAAYQSGVDYTIKGTGDTTYSLRSTTGFNASGGAVVVLDRNQVRVYSLEPVVQNALPQLFPVFGNPLAYNDSDMLYYAADGDFITDLPSTTDLQNKIRLLESNGDLYVNDILVLQGKVLCVVFDSNRIEYRFFHFDLADLNTDPEEVALTGVSMPVGTDNQPYFYTDGEFMYITNNVGQNVNDYELGKLLYNKEDAEISYVQGINLDNNFEATTNVVIKGGQLISFVEGELAKYNLSTGIKTSIGVFSTILGNIFNYKNEVYYTNGEVAKKWTV